MGSLGDYLDKFNSFWDKSDASSENSVELPPDVCPICGGLGYFTPSNAPIGHPAFGRAIVCECQQNNIAKQEADRRRNISNLTHYQNMSFDNFITSDVALSQIQKATLSNCIDKAYHFANNPEGWILFYGGYGCGKTHLAASIGNYCLTRGQSVIFMTIPDLLDHLRAAFGPNSELAYDEKFEMIREAPLLILDDLGAESPTAWANEKLYQLFNHRYVRRLPTVITTNCDFDRLDPRITSRLRDYQLCRLVNMQELPDYRSHLDDQTPGEISNVKIYEGMTFENFSTHRDEPHAKSRESLSKAAAAAKKFAEAPSQQWLIFVGKNGTGKTHLAAAIANARIKAGEPVYFVTLPDLLDYLRRSFEPNSRISLEKRFQEVCATDVLILDHFDLSAASSWAREKIFQLIEYRYVRRLPTVITKPGDSFMDLDPVFESRFSDSRLCRVIHISTPERKGKSILTFDENNRK